MEDYSLTMSDRNNCCQRILTKLTGRPWFISIVKIIVFIAQLSVSWSLTGTLIQIKPSFNLLIGSSAYVLIHMGARFAPRMQAIADITDDHYFYFPCPNYTGLTGQDSCTLSELCGFGGVSTHPNQWYRFIIPVFLHGGVLHITTNVFTQLIFGIPMEKKTGSSRLRLIYFISGIFGSVVSGNLAPYGSASVGCSGSVFGIIALFLLNLIFDWHNTSFSQFLCLLGNVVINLGLGLLPIIDNFAHIGGFIMGLLLGSVLLKPPTRFRRQKERSRTLSSTSEGKLKKFLYDHPGKWWLWWLPRFLITGITTALFVLSMLNIYRWNVQCTWCKYLNCLPVNNWCDTDYIRTTDMVNSTLTSPIDTTNLYTSAR